jgi:VanZ family protein
MVEIAIKTKLFTKWDMYIYSCHQKIESLNLKIKCHFCRRIMSNQKMIKKNFLSIIVAIVIMYLSLSGTEKLEPSFFSRIPHFDKIAHLLMYFGFMSVIIFENRKTLKTTGKLLLAAILPFLFGLLMEILQFYITLNRSGDFCDALFNLLGILLSLFIYKLFIYRFTGLPLR